MMKESLSLNFVDHNMKSYVDLCLTIDDRVNRSILLSPINQFALNFIKEVQKHKPQIQFHAFESEPELPQNVGLMRPNTPIDTTILFLPDAKKLSCELIKFIDLERGKIIAPKTKQYFENMPLFLISIPKSGTHLLYKLAENFGYIANGNCPDNPKGGKWYFLDSMNSHTSTTFLDFNKSSSNLYHPFLKSPALFIYRNPMDILVSESNFYHRDGKTAFWSYFNDLSFEERLLKLIDDPWLLGSIRGRMKDFISWLDIKNVIPISYEELVGPNGGGSERLQIKLIWSLQLKLHIPGDPGHFAKSVYDKNSPTFHKGRIGNFKKYFTDKAYEKFYGLPQDFVEQFGYNINYQKTDNLIPTRLNEFRARPLVLSEANFEKTPILMESSYFNHNIVKFKSRYYGVPRFLGNLHIEKQHGLTLKLFTVDENLNVLKQKIFSRRKIPIVILKVLWFLYLKLDNFYEYHLSKDKHD